MQKRKDLFLTISGNALLVILSIIAILFNEQIIKELFEIEVEISSIYKQINTDEISENEKRELIDDFLSRDLIMYISGIENYPSTDEEIDQLNFPRIIEINIRPQLRIYFSNFFFVNRLLLIMLIIYSAALIVYMVMNRSSQAHRNALSSLISRAHDQQEEIRKHVTSELHDDIIQTLAYLKRMSLGEQEMYEYTQTVSSVIEKVRELIGSLNSLEVKRIGFKGVLTEEVRRINKKSDIPITLSMGNFNDSKISPDVAQHLVRICQEAISNTVKHSGASYSSIRIVIIENSLRLKISDDGIGFTNKSQDFQNGIGLLSMKERVKDCGGSIEIKSQIGQGTIISIIIDEWSNGTNESSDS